MSIIRFIPTHVGNAASYSHVSVYQSVHPHARGERVKRNLHTRRGIGSSPRTWGTRGRLQRRTKIQRFIPTHVGNATARLIRQGRSAVHPHARGERLTGLTWVLYQDGSSPRTWGTQRPAARHRSSVRFIPTHVGNAVISAHLARLVSVHPHARGERKPRVIEGASVDGSSPRTWGTPRQEIAPQVRDRFIPTHVGNAAPQAAVSCRGACSSPRTWGTPPDHRRAPPDMRFIPTHVGNALPAPCQEPHGAVHPHARGERSRSRRRSTAVSGSSPRTWGTRPWRHRRPVRRRFIPTQVGNARERRSRSAAHTVHPHARGERDLTSRLFDRIRGSSPRTWGTLKERHDVCGQRRFIPTHVGNAAATWSRRSGKSVHPHARGEREKERTEVSEAIGSSPRTWGTLFSQAPVSKSYSRCQLPHRWSW